MTKSTESHQVHEVIAAALGQRLYMMHFCGREDLAVVLALFAERMVRYVPVSYRLPRPAVTFLDGRIAVVLFISSYFLLSVFLTELSVRKLRAAGM